MKIDWFLVVLFLGAIVAVAANNLLAAFMWLFGMGFGWLYHEFGERRDDEV